MTGLLGEGALDPQDQMLCAHRVLTHVLTAMT
jgi:hypothetical protein